MRYSDYLKINETFQYSINLQFDINNINKLKEYIPTSDSCEILENYFDSIFKKFNKSTILVGPYGKGKSHLLLVLLTLLNDYNEEDDDIINDLLNKINKINVDVYEKIRSVRDKKMKFMPVIINSNYNNINQAFLLALNEALERENIDGIVIDTYFDAALQIIDKWENGNDNEIISKFKTCLDKKKLTLKKLKDGLKIYNEEYYNIFKDVYSCVLHGIEFNPLINTDIVKYYKDVNYKISQLGYTGMLVIFDEFSKFLEYVGNESMMRDLKTLQDFAEMASRTGNSEQVLFSCITHKAINSYLKNLKDEKANAFKTVEGRFKEIYFNRSIEQNYEIIEQTIEKTDKFEDFITKKLQSKKLFYEDIKNEFPFCRSERVERVLFKGCFPLNPATVYAVMSLSEKVAQNERTLFTFLTDDDVYSFKHFIYNSKKQELFNVDKIYDYFYNILKKDNDEFIKEIWLKSENAISKTSDTIEISILKIMAIIYMINDFENYPPTEQSIRLSLDISQELLDLKIKEMLEKGLVKKRKSNGLLEFSTLYNKEFLNEINIIKKNKFDKINVSQVLEKIYDMGYILPRRYNQNFKMTRFFKSVFITENEIENLKSFKLILEKYNSDGIVLNLLRTSKNIDSVIENFDKINNPKVIIKIPNILISEEFIDTLKEIEAINYYQKTEKIDADILRELKNLYDENMELVQSEVRKIYEISSNSYAYYKKEKKNSNELGSLSSEICEEIYCDSPIINNEMINKQTISTPIAKARGIVIDSIINKNKDLIKSETSAEATIYKAIVDKKEHSDINKVIKIIENYVKDSEKGGKRSFENLIKKLKQEPFNIRNGVIPIFIAMALIKYADNIVLYYQNKEIEFNSNNISKIIDEPGNYYVLLETGTQEKIIFINKLMDSFQIQPQESQRENIKHLMHNIKKWTLSLPRITREVLDTNVIISEQASIELKNNLLKSDINNNEFFFNTLRKIYNEDDFGKLHTNIVYSKKEIDEYLKNFENYVVNELKILFEKNTQNSLNKVLKRWYLSNENKIQHVVVSAETKQLLDYIKQIDTFNEEEIIENISYIVMGYYIEDWQEKSYEEFFAKIKNIVNELNGAKINNNENKLEIKFRNQDGNSVVKFIENIEISSIGKTLMNNIEDSINEYGDSINENEKIKILMDILNKYM